MSQICSLTPLFRIVVLLQPKSIPMVLVKSSLNESFKYRISKQLLPLPDSPARRILYIQSLFNFSKMEKAKRYYSVDEFFGGQFGFIFAFLVAWLKYINLCLSNRERTLKFLHLASAPYLQKVRRSPVLSLPTQLVRSYTQKTTCFVS